jgi:hypothetical protein
MPEESTALPGYFACLRLPTSQGTSWSCPCALTVEQNRFTVDKDVMHTSGQGVAVIIGGVISQSLGIKNRQVREPPFPNLTA